MMRALSDLGAAGFRPCDAQFVLMPDFKKAHCSNTLMINLNASMALWICSVY